MLLGADSRGTAKNDTPRSDTIMIASVDPVTKKAALFSILRDTYVKIPGHGQDRINTAFSLGGPNLAMKTAGDLLGLPIQYYVYTDFQGFMALVDAIGGIELDVEKDMKYRDSEEPEFDINLKKGLQHMDGKTALQYVRFRHDALSDYARTERQRKFMTAVAEEMQTTSSILRLPSILNKIDPYITTNMSISDMIKLASLGFEVKANGVTGVQVPPSNLLDEENIGGASVLTVNPAKLQKYVKEQLGATGTAVADADEPDSGDAKTDSKSSGSETATRGSNAASTGTSGSSASTGSSGSAAAKPPASTSASKPATSTGTSKPATTPAGSTGTATSGGAKAGTAPSSTTGGKAGTTGATAPSSGGSGSPTGKSGSSAGKNDSAGASTPSSGGSGSTSGTVTGNSGSSTGKADSAAGSSAPGASSSSSSTGATTGNGGSTSGKTDPAAGTSTPSSSGSGSSSSAATGKSETPKAGDNGNASPDIRGTPAGTNNPAPTNKSY
jgi:LCP family protein required for cell wall assembly